MAVERGPGEGTMRAVGADIAYHNAETAAKDSRNRGQNMRRHSGFGAPLNPQYRPGNLH